MQIDHIQAIIKVKHIYIRLQKSERYSPNMINMCVVLVSGSNKMFQKTGILKANDQGYSSCRKKGGDC